MGQAVFGGAERQAARCPMLMWRLLSVMR
jgi:hypothetical protein